MVRLLTLPISGGTPRRIDDAPYRWTEALPGNYVLNVRYDTNTGRYRAWASNLMDRKDERSLVEADSRVIFAPLGIGDPEGHLLYVRSGTLEAQPFNARTLQLQGDPQPIAEKVLSFNPSGAASFSVSSNGVLVYRTAAVPLTPAPFQLPTDWSRDGRFVLYQTTGGAGEPGADIVAVDLANGRTVPLLHSEAQKIEAVLSPDGSTLAYISDETGRPELYVQEFAADPEPHVTGPKRQISHDGASVIRWRADGAELFYIGSDNWITAVALSVNRLPGTPRRLFRVNFPPRQLTAAGPAVGFDVTPAGDRFILPDTTDLQPSPFIVIQNWTLLLRHAPQ